MLYHGYEAKGEPVREDVLTTGADGAFTWALPTPQQTVLLLFRSADEAVWHGYGRELLIRGQSAPEDINVTIEDRVLSIRTESATEEESKDDSYVVRERRTGSYRRSLRLPESVEAENVESGYEHGVLTITLPKRKETKAKRIEVKVA